MGQTFGCNVHGQLKSALSLHQYHKALASEFASDGALNPAVPTILIETSVKNKWRNYLKIGGIPGPQQKDPSCISSHGARGGREAIRVRKLSLFPRGS